MRSFTDWKHEHGYVLPPHPMASGRATMSLEGYPAEDDEPMAATEFHGIQITTLSYQLRTFFRRRSDTVYVGTDSFIYYVQGDTSQKVAPDVYVVLGVDAIPARRSFYIWEEGAVPTVAFEFLSESTGKVDREDKVTLYLQEIGMQEYFLHQPEAARPLECRGWRRTADGRIIDIEPDARGWLKSEALNLWFFVEDQPTKVRLMRPAYPDGTPLPTYDELEQERDYFKEEANEAQARARVAEAKAQAAEAKAQTAEAKAQAEANARAQLEAELERLRLLLAQRSE
ncbi:Uma2 family endonuclease [Candidatus Poribacteria bacterium]|nr:Uma2 family endonuclease [Candidatus Poribacteria bacterium]